MVSVARRLAGMAGVRIGEVTVILCDDAGIAPVNEATVGHSGPTDVITLPCEPIPGVEDEPSAEIVVNVECAVAQRPENPSLELAYYIAHAFDHLSGRDDDTPARRTAMHRRERRWLAELGNDAGKLIEDIRLPPAATGGNRKHSQKCPSSH